MNYATVDSAMDMLWDARENLEAMAEEFKKIRAELKIASEALYFYHYNNLPQDDEKQWHRISENDFPREREDVFLYFKDKVVIGYLYQSITKPNVRLWNIHNWLYDLEEVEYWMPTSIIGKPEEQKGEK